MIGDIVIANIIASAGLVLLIYFFDMNEKEPPWILVRIYVISILVTFLFGKLKTFLFQRYDWQFSELISNYIVAGFFEEALKLFIVLIFVWHLKSFNEESDGIVYYLIVAAGFAVLENVGYSFQFVLKPYLYGRETGEMGFYKKALETIVLFRAVSGHIFINVVSGVFLGLAKKNHRWWILIPGFVVSVLLHGTWNQMATMGFLGLFVLSFLTVDIILFILVLRMSFYFKFVNRLKLRVKLLIREAREKAINPDVITLMETIRDKVGCLRSMEGDVLALRAKEIVGALPARIEPEEDGSEPGGLIEKLLKINGILSRDHQRTGKGFWFFLFLKFAVTGFFVLMFLVNLM